MSLGSFPLLRETNTKVAQALYWDRGRLARNERRQARVVTFSQKTVRASRSLRARRPRSQCSRLSLTSAARSRAEEEVYLAHACGTKATLSGQWTSKRLRILWFSHKTCLP